MTNCMCADNIALNEKFVCFYVLELINKENSLIDLIKLCITLQFQNSPVNTAQQNGRTLSIMRNRRTLKRRKSFQ